MNNSDQADDADPIAAFITHQQGAIEYGKAFENRRKEAFERVERLICRAIQLWQSCNAAAESSDAPASVSMVSAALINFVECVQTEGWNERTESGPYHVPDGADIELKDIDGVLHAIVTKNGSSRTYRAVQQYYAGHYGEDLVGQIAIYRSMDSIDYMRSQNHPSTELNAVIHIVTAAINGDRKEVERCLTAVLAAKDTSKNLFWTLGQTVTGSILERANIYDHDLQNAGWIGKRKDHVYSADIEQFRKDVAIVDAANKVKLPVDRDTTVNPVDGTHREPAAEGTGEQKIPGEAPPDSGQATKELTGVDHAIALLIKDPSLTYRQLQTQVGTPRATLQRDDTIRKIKDAFATTKASSPSVRRGSKSKDGSIEAVDDRDDDDLDET